MSKKSRSRKQTTVWGAYTDGIGPVYACIPTRNRRVPSNLSHGVHEIHEIALIDEKRRLERNKRVVGGMLERIEKKRSRNRLKRQRQRRRASLRKRIARLKEQVVLGTEGHLIADVLLDTVTRP